MTTYDIIKSRTTTKDIIEHVKKITLRHERGETYTGECFKCGGSESGTKFRAYNSGFYCFGCNIKGNLVDLVKQLKDINTKETYKWLIEQYAPDKKYSKQNFEAFKKSIQEEKETKAENYYLNEFLYEAIFEWGKKLLFQPEGKVVLDYLTVKRKYKVEKIKKSDFFLMPSIKQCQSYLIKGFPEQADYIKRNSKKQDEKNEKKYLSLYGGFKETFPLGIAYRDEDGCILGFAYRSIKPKGETVTNFDGSIKKNQRYNSTSGLKKRASLFNIYQNKKKEELLVVEGYPDATYLSQYSELNVCAIAQAQVGEAHINSLIRCNIKKVILSLDNDEIKEKDKYKSPSEVFYIKRKRVKGALKYLAAKKFPSSIIDPDFLSPAKDIDEKYRIDGIKGVEEVIAKKKECVDYLIYLIEEESKLKIEEEGEDEEHIQFLLERYLEYKKIIAENQQVNFMTKFLECFKSKGITEKSVERLEQILNSQLVLSEAELLCGLDRLRNNRKVELDFLYSEHSLLKAIFEGRHQRIFEHICEQQISENPKISLNRRILNRFNRIKQNSFISIISDKDLPVIILKDFNQRVFLYHEIQLKQAPFISFASINSYFKKLSTLSDICKKISDNITQSEN